MITKVRKSIENYKEYPMVVAVSGGADSVALLLGLCQLREEMGLNLHVLHVEHGIRGEESKKDASFVENLCQELKVPCRVVPVDVPSYCAKEKVGTEEGARCLRYSALSTYAKFIGGVVLLAHHMDDQAETMLFQMLRGSGLRGLGGMRRSRRDQDGVTYLRPLLSVHRREIEAYLAEQGQAYCTDSTNQEMEYHRNYIRKEIMPRLAEVNSQGIAHMARTAEQLAEVSDYLRQEARSFLEEEDALGEKTGLTERSARGSIERLQSLHPVMQKQVVYEMLLWVAGSHKDLGSVHLEQLLGLIELQSGKQVHLPDGIVARREFGLIVIERKLEEDPNLVEELFFQPGSPGKSKREVEIAVQNEMFYCRTFSFSGKMEEIPQKQYTKWFDYDKISDGFSIRTRKSGDYLICDAAGHHKRLKNYFIEEKWSAKKRDTAWILAQDAHVLWVVGGRISETVKVTEDTKWILEITYAGGKEDESYPG